MSAGDIRSDQISCSVVSDSLRPHESQHARPPCPWDSPGKNTGVGFHFLLQCMKVKIESEVMADPQRPHGLQPTRLLHPWDFPGKSTEWVATASSAWLCMLLLSRFSRVRLWATPETAAHPALPSLGFSRQEHWSGLPFPSPLHESEKLKGSRSVVSHSSDPMDCSLPGSSIHGIFQARVLEWGAIAFSAYLVTFRTGQAAPELRGSAGAPLSEPIGMDIQIDDPARPDV